MTIKFGDNNYKELFNDLFSEVAGEFALNIACIDDTTMELIGDNFTLSISYDMDTSWIYFTNKETKKTYLISNYINVNAEGVDRDDLPKVDIISKSIERTLTIQSRVIKRKFIGLLEGKLDWFDSYKESQFFHEVNR